MARLIVLLLCLKLHVKVGHGFQFEGQTSNTLYWFTKYELLEMTNGYVIESSVSLNKLLYHKCKVCKPTTGAGRYVEEYHDHSKK